MFILCLSYAYTMSRLWLHYVYTMTIFLCLYYVYNMSVLCLYHVSTMSILSLYYVYTMCTLCLYYVQGLQAMSILCLYYAYTMSIYVKTVYNNTNNIPKKPQSFIKYTLLSLRCSCRSASATWLLCPHQTNNITQQSASTNSTTQPMHSNHVVAHSS